MNQPEISIIVPIYNVEKYLDKCIQSIRAQTFSDLEIILVDDGSPDRCGEMCDTYAQEDPRIRVIHKANGGLSDARNAGIDVAQGKYLGFVDSDDFIEPDMYEMLHDMIVRENADVAECGIDDCYKGFVPAAAEISAHFFVLNTEEAVKHALENRVNVWCRLYRKEVFEDLRFPVGKVSEDAHIMIRLLAKTNRVVVTDAKKYHYIHREGSITTLTYRPQILSMIEAWENNFAFVKERYPKLVSPAERRYLWANFCVLDRMMLDPERSDLNKKNEIVHLLRKNIWKILKNPGFRLTRKIAALCLLVSPGLYCQCALAYWRRHKLVS